VCSAQDSFKKQPRLGRGVTRAEAEANARWLAAMTANNHSDFFVETLTCEGSNSGAGAISIESDSGSLRVMVQGPSQAQCISKNSMRNSGFPYIATAGTMTEAKALSSNACTVGSNDNGFFCETTCERISSAGSVNGSVQVPGLKLPGLKLPRFKFPKIRF
ncbi:MAG: hypothetical protein H7333_00905, partial [Bdellovibrionales bacterium]|nr:hypothetical protein [Oligoflexia bacterium]